MAKRTAVQTRRLRRLAAYLAGPVARAQARSAQKGVTKFAMYLWCGWNTADKEHKTSRPPRIGITKELCGTQGCALGYATALFPRLIKLSKFGLPVFRNNTGNPWSISKRLFGLTSEEVGYAFTPIFWPGGMDRTPRQAAKALRDLANGKPVPP